MRKSIALIGLAAVLFAIGPVQQIHAAKESNATVGYTRSNFKTFRTTYVFIITEDGDVIPGVQNAQDIGNSTTPWRRISAAQIDASSGIQNVVETFLDQPRAS